MMRHAYLIIAHTEFEVLKLLVQTLDDNRNDIYIHFDAKVQELPSLSTEQAGLYLLSHRVDVRWGDVSQLEVEYCLFEAAHGAGRDYGYYHLLSGVDLPLKSQDYIHEFCSTHQGKQFIGFSRGEAHEVPLERKVNMIHLFHSDFKGSGLLHQAKRALRFACLRLQMLLGLRVNKGIEFKKGTQWLSITDALVGYILEHKEEVMCTYRHSFCPDEIFVQTLVWHSPFRDAVYNYDDEGRSCMREIGWRDNRLLDYTAQDLPRLKASAALFARKFNSRDMDFLLQLLGDRGSLQE